MCTYKTESKHSDVTMTVHIDALQKVESSDHFTGKKHTFDILVLTALDGKEEAYSFKCESSEDKKKWIREIEQAKARRKKDLQKELKAPVSCCSIL